MMVGFQPDARAGRLYLDPALPDWMRHLTLKDLRVNGLSFDLRLWRDDEATRWEVLKGDPALVAQRSLAAPAS